jgi:hypothetical protein
MLIGTSLIVAGVVGWVVAGLLPKPKPRKKEFVATPPITVQVTNEPAPAPKKRACAPKKVARRVVPMAELLPPVQPKPVAQPQPAQEEEDSLRPEELSFVDRGVTRVAKRGTPEYDILWSTLKGMKSARIDSHR